MNQNIYPQISHSCLVKFQSVYNDLKSAERRAADYCLEHPDTVTGTTISEVATLAGCSEATFVRLARRLGYAGYPEMRAQLLKDEDEDIVHYNGLSLKDDVPTITQSVFQASIQALQDSLESIDFAKLEQAVQKLMRAHRIQLVGAGDASAVALAGVQKFSRLGYLAFHYSDFDSQLIALSQMSEEDIFICISHSGRTKSICEIAKCAREKGITVIAITNFPLSPLTKNSDITLLTAAFARDTMGEIITKRIPALCALEALYVCALMRTDNTHRNVLTAGNQLLRRNKL